MPERFSRWTDFGRMFALITALLISVGCLFYGFAGKYVDTPSLWRPEGMRELECFSALYWVSFFAIGYFRKHLVRPTVLAAAAGVLLAVAGPWTVFSVVVFFLASWAIGNLLFQDQNEPPCLSAEMELLRLCAGLALIETFLYVTARIPLYYPAVLLVLLITPILCRWRQAWFLLGRLFRHSLSRTGAKWEIFAESLLGFILFCSLLLALSPEVGTDALDMHLAVGTNMAVHHRFTYTPATVSWSAMPLGADFCFAVVYNLGGEIAVRLENFGFLIFLLALLFRLGRRLTDRRADLYLVLAMFASCSLVQFAVDTVMVENMWALLCTGLLFTILKYRENSQDRYLLLYSVLGGGAMMIKLGSLAFLLASLPFVAYALWRKHNHGEFHRIFLWASAALLLLSAIPYVLAYGMTENPVFPFANAIWKSPLINTSTNLVDPRWRAPIHATILFDLTFKTSKYLESRAGGIGYTLLLFALPCLVTISRKWKFVVVACAIIPLLFFCLTFNEVRYARYLYPGLAIVSLLIVYPLHEAHRLSRGLYIAMAGLSVAGTGLNYYFAPAFGGQQAAFFSFTARNRARYVEEYRRPALPISYLNWVVPAAPVLFVDTVDITGLKAQPYALTWHFYPLNTEIQHASNVDEISRILGSRSIDYVLHSVVLQERWPVRNVSEAHRYEWSSIYVPALFETFLQTCTVSVFNAAGWEIRKVNSCSTSPLQRKAR